MKRWPWISLGWLCAAVLISPPVLAQTRPENRPTVQYVVRTGDTLIGLGEAGFKRPSDYRQVQALNNVADPRRMPTGLILTIPADLLRWRPASANLVGFRGDVAVHRANATLPVALNASVVEDDVITTGANAFARFGLPDGSFLSVPSHSRVRLSRLRLYALNNAVDSEVTVLAGRTESQVAPVRGPGAYRITTPMSVTAVRGTDFRVSYDPTLIQSSTEVLHGVVGVSVDSGVPAALVEADEALVTNTNGSYRVTLLEPPRLLNPGSPQVDEMLSFEVASIANAVAYRGRLSRDSEGRDFLEEATSEPGAERLELPTVEDGIYFIRLTALSDLGVEGRPSSYRFERSYVQANRLSVNALDALQFRFQWRVPDGIEPNFTFQLHRTDGPSPGLVLEENLAVADIAIPISDAGNYEWRVGLNRQLDGRSVQIWSEPARLRVSR